MTSPVYNVPVILRDLRREESYQQVVDALEYLDAIANDIFNRISCRVADNRDQLTGLNNRINVARAKIELLRSSSTKATKVFSSPKYPAPEQVTEYHTLYQDVAPQLQKVRKNKREVEARLPEVTLDVIRAKGRPFIFDLGLRARRSRGASRRRITDDPEQGEGLGSLPKHLPSVSSLLLFNTAENPYKKYVLLDPLSGATTKTRDNIIEDESELAEAPYSITQGEELGRGTQDSIMYVPVMPELPELEVPETLPHLLQVATDEFYSADVGQSIAPSLANTVVPELPNLADPEAPAATAPPPSSSQPPPPAPPPVGTIELPSPATPPPPPPPPPPMEALPPVANSDDESEGDPGGDDDRANLMAAIRKAGGADKAGLKDAESKKHQRKAKKEEEQSGGDLLGDLSAALNRRRKAMSGRDKEKAKEEKKDEDHTLGGGSMMDNISRMIPPPRAPRRPRADTQSSDEPDW